MTPCMQHTVLVRLCRAAVGGVLLLLPLLLLPGCSSEDLRPKGVPSEAEMAAVLYDYHVAQALAETAAADEREDYVAEVLAAHGLTEAQFDAACSWYAAHSDRLLAVYKRMESTLEAGASAGGATWSSAHTQGDTLSLWRGAAVQLLSPTGRRYLSIEALGVDTLVQPGDRLCLSLNARWVQREGMRQGVAALAVRYANDSVAVVSQPFSGESVRLWMTTDDSLKVTKVGGFVVHLVPQDKRVRLLIVQQPEVLRIRGQHKAADGAGRTPEPALKSDSAASAAPLQTRERMLRDSLVREERQNREAPHFRESAPPLRMQREVHL